MAKYRIVFEIVAPMGRGAKYYDAAQKNPICNPAQVAEEDWAKTENNTDNPQTQFRNLRKWAESGERLVRNVRLYKTSETVTDVTDKPID